MKTIILILLFSLFGSSCYGQQTATFTLEAIDSTSLDMYYLYTLIDNNNKKFKVLSEKSNDNTAKGIRIKIGDKIILSLEKVIDVKVDSNNVIRVGSRGLFVSGIKICEQGEHLYISKNILGRYYY